MEKWSRNYSKCKNCGTTTIKHISKGLCSNCYTRLINSSNRGEKIAENQNNPSIIIKKEFLENEYIKNCKSLGDIAKMCFCSRQYVYQKIREFGITTRDKTIARTLALNSGKLIFKNIDENGSENITVLKKIHINKGFFDVWSDEMAYVLGVIYTDGNIYVGNKSDNSLKTVKTMPRISIVQKEPELLEKVKLLMNCDAPLYHRKEKYYNGIKSGSTYSLSISNYPIFNSLLKIGLTPNKSLTMVFPNVPDIYFRHFVRGCWDGDGSVFINSSSRNIAASFVCGSSNFIEVLLQKLEKFGVLKGKISIQHGKHDSYKLRYHGQNCYKLYELLYKNVNNIMYLMRKHKVFYDYFGSI